MAMATRCLHLDKAVLSPSTLVATMCSHYGYRKTILQPKSLYLKDYLGLYSTIYLQGLIG